MRRATVPIRLSSLPAWLPAWLVVWTVAAGLLSGCRTAGSLGSKAGGPSLRFEVERLEPEFGPAGELLTVLADELERNFATLSSEAVDQPAYFMAYDLVGTDSLWLEANDGALDKRHVDGRRNVDIDIRVGAPELDNGHPTNGYYGGNGLGLGLSVSLDDDALSLAQALWMGSELQYRAALEAWLAAVNSESMLTRDDGPQHPDFTAADEPLVHLEAPRRLDLAAVGERWAPLISELSAILDAAPEVQQATVLLQVEVDNRSYVDTEGARVQTGRTRTRLMMAATTQAEDGMTVERFVSFDRHDPSQLPAAGELKTSAEGLRDELLALREAPVAEPYTGPAVLEGPAAGVFFHEIFGHRLEGHRQKDDDEGQTFTGMLGEPILPAFLDVYDDPTLASLDGTPLSGHYFVDDEAIVAQRASLVEAGVLAGFLLSRSVVSPFAVSNGHGRRQPGNRVVARQGNLIVSARKTVPEGELRERLIAEAKAADKPYGLWFADIQGGYTITDRSGPQAFKVLPLLVYRVWTDGRPDELVRGADIVGTPLSAFETIIAAGDRPGIFNGVCGAESGWVPVSAVSPSLLLRKLEIERAVHERDKPPLLPPPPGRDAGSFAEGRR